MGKSLADALNAQPGPDSLAYWVAQTKDMPPPAKNWWRGRRESTNVEDLTRPMTTDEQAAAYAATVFDSALGGNATPALAGVMSALPGRGNYTEELGMAENLQKRLQSQYSGRNVALRAGGTLMSLGPQRALGAALGAPIRTAAWANLSRLLGINDWIDGQAMRRDGGLGFRYRIGEDD